MNTQSRLYRLLASAVVGLLLFSVAAPAVAAVCAHGIHAITSHAESCVCPLHADPARGDHGHDDGWHGEAPRVAALAEGMPCHGTRAASTTSSMVATAAAGGSHTDGCCAFEASTPDATKAPRAVVERVHVPADLPALTLRSGQDLSASWMPGAPEEATADPTPLPIYLLNAVFLI